MAPASFSVVEPLVVVLLVSLFVISAEQSNNMRRTKRFPNLFCHTSYVLSFQVASVEENPEGTHFFHSDFSFTNTKLKEYNTLCYLHHILKQSTVSCN